MLYATAPDDAILSNTGDVINQKLKQYTGFVGDKSTTADYFQVPCFLYNNTIIYGHSIMVEVELCLYVVTLLQAFWDIVHCQVDGLSELFSEMKNLSKDHEQESKKEQKVFLIILDDVY